VPLACQIAQRSLGVNLLRQHLRDLALTFRIDVLVDKRAPTDITAPAADAPAADDGGTAEPATPVQRQPSFTG
jgi:hypothetical protein